MVRMLDFLPATQDGARVELMGTTRLGCVVEYLLDPKHARPGLCSVAKSMMIPRVVICTAAGAAFVGCRAAGAVCKAHLYGAPKPY